MTTKTILKPITKNKIATFRFTLTPQMEQVFFALEQKYKMLDRTEIVKLGLSNLVNQTDDADSNANQLDTFDQAMDFWNANKKEFRI
jgi:hypothetical protein